MTATCYYTCDLLPGAFLARTGCTPRRLPLSGSVGAHDDSTIHPTICPYVADLVNAADATLRADPSAGLVVPAGCDAMRRAGDVLAARFADRVHTLMLPRSPGEAAVDALSRDLEQLERWLRALATGSDSLGPAPQSPATPGGGALFALPDGPSGDGAGGILVVGGPLSNAGLLEAIAARGVPVGGVESCTSPERARALDAAVGPDTPVVEVARAVLREVTCPRHDRGQRRERLSRRLDAERPRGVLYARLPFCDPGAYDSLLVSALAAERGLPYLEVEVGFPFELSGPLRVRLEAFLETLTLGGGGDGDGLFDDDLFDDDPAASLTAEKE